MRGTLAPGHHRRPTCWLLPVVFSVLFLQGCYSFRPSAGGGQTDFDPPRTVNPADVALPAGFRIEAVATGLSFPTGVAFDEAGRPHVVEAGYSYGEVFLTPRLLRVEPDGSLTTIASGGDNGPWNGVASYGNTFYVAEGGVRDGGRILRIATDGAGSRASAEALVEGLPGYGDHHANGPVVARDGTIYFSVGTATNSAVVGPDNAEFGWLERRPDFHDVPCRDVYLAGRQYESDDPRGGGRVRTGAFQPYGEAGTAGQLVRGQVPCNGALFRMDADGRDLELVAWGFRNPFGLAFSPAGRLYVTDNGYDNRGSRPVFGAPDVLWQVTEGAWYGWPDYVAGQPVEDERFAPPDGEAPQFVLAAHPDGPRRPEARFGVHSSANGFDFSFNPDFGYVNEAFVALFGDQAPGTGKVMAPVGFKLVRVDLLSGVVRDFAVNRGEQNGPASRIGGGGFERPVAARFDHGGAALYVVDFGVLLETGGETVPQPETGVLWRITRSPAEEADVP